eukprot:6210850-Pleurochrysis_carterae.AAC.1
MTQLERNRRRSNAQGACKRIQTKQPATLFTFLLNAAFLEHSGFAPCCLTFPVFGAAQLDQHAAQFLRRPTRLHHPIISLSRPNFSAPRLVCTPPCDTEEPPPRQPGASAQVRQSGPPRPLTRPLASTVARAH